MEGYTKENEGVLRMYYSHHLRKNRGEEKLEYI
jgi:hypothetical protein